MRALVSAVLLTFTSLCFAGGGPTLSDSSACQKGLNPQEVLAQINALRTQPRQCGAVNMPPAQALRWDPRLAASAQAFAGELSQRNELSHISALGLTLRKRFRLQGYPLMRAGENLAGGQETLDEVMLAWVSSAAHCDNLMEPSFVDVGMACVVGPGQYERYWVLHLGRAFKD
ncbi:CAP domain-containing protein [Paucibacter sp. KBW04]|uniref:CAP domain-containing protein n=1 Tax=Paucibacter sp. KBW04 TaxID=2153361 RepID=UPI000F55F582|nr:CAP domain-containing protein [Paucibacter sp. KBW04]RQO60411.1 CAP domain-containing protein [Paucibacter sp. KBW04]